MKTTKLEYISQRALRRARQVLSVILIGAGITFAAMALASGPKGPSGKGGSAHVTADKPAANDDLLADRYDTLVMRVYFRDRDERDRLAQELSAEEVPTTGGYLTIIRDRSLYYELKARGLRVEVDESASKHLSEMAFNGDTFYSGYKTVEEIYAYIDQKVAAFPGLVEKVDIGDSWCKLHPGSCNLPAPWNGYDLYVLHITNRNIPGPKPVFWADGGIHAREIATPEIIMRLVDYLLDNYDTNADAHWLVDYHDIWLMPDANPDGHHIVEAGGNGNSPYLYRKNGDNVGGAGCSWPPTVSDQFGVDNNRNFPFHWGCCNGSSGFVCDQTYRGVSAGSDPEDTAIVNQLRILVPDQRGPNDTDPAPLTTTGVYQNIHSDAAVNLFPWGWSSVKMPNFAETNNIAAHMSAKNAAGNGYGFGSIIGQLYPVDGGSIDWAYGELGMAAFSTEIGGQDFLPAYSCIDNPGCGSTQGLWPDNQGMLLYLAKIARTPYLTSHGPDANSVITSPSSVTQGMPAQLTATINFAWTRNAFSQNVGAAEYYIDTPPWAGGTAIPMSGSFTSPTVAVSATIDTSGLAAGRHVIFVRGRGVTDYLGFQTWGPMSAAFLDVTGSTTSLVSAASRLTHGTAGTFDVPMPLTGSSGVECRLATTYNAVFTFDAPVTSGQVTVLSGTATVGAITFSGNSMIVQLTGVTSAEIVTLHTQNINGDGQSHGDVPFGFLTGDADATRVVGKSDQTLVQSQLNQPVTGSNFREDLNADGRIKNADVNIVKTNKGHSIP
jgi:carboxypeptidase T